MVKIGEGTFGEAFRASGVVFKIVAMEGDAPYNGCPQKGAADILAEGVIALTLSQLRERADAAGGCAEGWLPPPPRRARRLSCSNVAGGWLVVECCQPGLPSSLASGSKPGPPSPHNGCCLSPPAHLSPHPPSLPHAHRRAQASPLPAAAARLCTPSAWARAAAPTRLSW